MSAPIVHKAARLIVEGRVHARGSAAIFYVRDGVVTHIVAIGDDCAFSTCSCPSTSEACAHVLAATHCRNEAADARAAAHTSVTLERSAA